MHLYELMQRILNGDYSDHDKMVAIRVLAQEALKVEVEAAEQAAVTKTVEAIFYGLMWDLDTPIPAPMPLPFHLVAEIIAGFAAHGVILTFIGDDRNGVFYRVR